MSDGGEHQRSAPIDLERRTLLQAPAWTLLAAPVGGLIRGVLSHWFVPFAAALATTPVHAQSSLTRALRARRLPSDALKVDFPPLADSGLAVPYSVEVTSPEGRRLQMLEVLLPENPMPLALRVRLPVPQANWRLSTRLRLAASQEAWVVATFDDGSQQAAGAATVVTSSACLDES